MEQLPWRQRVHEIVYEADTPEGKAFDVGLIVAIVASVLVVMLESVAAIQTKHGTALRVAEWVFTVLFTVEYALRLAVVERPGRYARSFFGVVDLLAIVPTYVSLFAPGAQALTVIRALRILRVFRVLKLVHYVRESRALATALRASGRKVLVFLFTVLILVVILGSTMYLVEGEDNGFTSIPRSIYWAVVTLTTVGYGDIAPQTPMGQALAALVMILGYAIIAVPTGILSVEMARVEKGGLSTQACKACSAEGHDANAVHCKFCGAAL